MSLPDSHSSGVAQHDHQADGGRRRGAEAGVDQVHVLEHHPDGREQRRVFLRFGAAHDRRGEDRGFVLRQQRAAGRERLQHAADRLEIGEQLGAAVAPLEVGTDGDLLGDAELAVVERLQAAPRRRAGERLHALLASRSSWRSAWRARVSRDFTVPTATPSEKAISS
jgi:hypothetical protein